LALGQSEYAEDGVMMAGTTPIGPLLALPAFAEQTIPSNLGASSTEDRVIVTRPSDHLLFEREPSFRVMLEPLSGNLQARIQYMAFVAAIQDRQPTATCVVSGTGMIVQTGFGA